MTKTIAFDQAIDASGLSCPMPILKAKKALAPMASGQVLKVTTTDPHALEDFQAFAKQTKNVLVQQDEVDGKLIHYLRRR